MGPLRSPSRTSPLQRPPGRSAYVYGPALRLCVRTRPRTAGNRQQNRYGRYIRRNRGGLFWGRFAALRGQVRSNALRAEARMCTGRRFACVGTDSSANCREPAAKPVHTVHQTQPRWPILGPLRSPSRTSPLQRPPGRSALCVRTGRRFACVGADSSANCREPAAKSIYTVHRTQPRSPVSGPLRSPSRTSPLQRPPGRSALCVRTGRRPAGRSLLRV
ncbi:hypothetical protein PSCFBP3800_02049 [Pseudomonas syringae group genomosp. 3]|uniref:Uncharacterized protein n=1 Tax=Pseudomonas syringae group genomosp. 3 TaxID=251701 RepID=A0A2K4WBH5_9PSED|nr:hypothetical protein CFBP6411_01880 [Pseudomonas syringae group genomosp. 3]SPF12084.1 hypothetical protein PSCFBP3800_02049 [Pseudomonas syringae group genomosp. 3]